MQAQALVQIRIDRPLKEEVAEIFSSIGIDMSTAIRMFFLRCRKVKGIPFALNAEDDSRRLKFGVSRGKWSLPDDWEVRDKAMDKEIEADFYGNSF